MQYAINLTRKHPSFRKALKDFLEHPCIKDGVHCEFGSPKQGDLDITWWLRRVRQVNDDRVCARMTNPVWSDDEVTFTVEPFGPMGKEFERFQSGGQQFSISARKEEFRDKRIGKILALDMIDATRHIDYNPA